jgi:hypothetical protein
VKPKESKIERERERERESRTTVVGWTTWFHALASAQLNSAFPCYDSSSSSKEAAATLVLCIVEHCCVTVLVRRNEKSFQSSNRIANEKTR